MADEQNFVVRIWFQKLGRLVHLSHLEVARSLERAVRRAQLPYAISQGFSPHMKISFGAALPVGVGGYKECFDLRLTQYVSPDVVVESLQKASVKDLMVVSGTAIASKDPAASIAYPVSEYEVVLSESFETSDTLEIPETITVIRKKKEKVLEVSEFLYKQIEQAGSTLNISLIAKPTGSLRIDVFLRELLKDTQTVPLSIIRTDQRSF